MGVTRGRREAAERRSEPRHAPETEPLEPLWLFCPKRAVGGQAVISDVSANGIGITVSRAGSWRLVAALREAHASASDVEVSRIPSEQRRSAKIVWIGDGDAREIRFGLRLSEPLRRPIGAAD